MAVTVNDLRMRRTRAAIHLVDQGRFTVSQRMATIINPAMGVTCAEPGQVIGSIRQVTAGRRHVGPMVRASVDFPVVDGSAIMGAARLVSIDNCNGMIAGSVAEYMAPHQ